MLTFMIMMAFFTDVLTDDKDNPRKWWESLLLVAIWPGALAEYIKKQVEEE